MNTRILNTRTFGFTLVELAVTIALAAILIALGVPALQQMVQDNRQANEINSLLVSLNRARAAAVKHGSFGRMCVSDQEPTPNCAENDEWENGWIVFIDGNPPGGGDGAYTPPSDGNDRWDQGEDLLLQVRPPLTQGTTLRGNGPVEDDIRFNPRGFSQTGTFRLCDSRGAESARAIVVNNTGRAYLAVDTDDLSCDP